jgi:hypothetical protein
MIGRREFITLIAGAVTTSPMGADAQQPAMPVVGNFCNDIGTKRRIGM